MRSAIDLRPLISSEQPDAIALWQAVFSTPAGFFERYFDAQADPYFRDGDTFGAWVEDRLVSAVHICRRPVQWDGGTLLCGGIANVATLPDFRRQGLSHRLLEMTLDKMQEELFDFSLLGTGVHSHYAALEWEQINAPRVAIASCAEARVGTQSWLAWQGAAPLAPLYAPSPRPAQFERMPAYFQNWAVWNWDRAPVQAYALGERGYLLIADGSPDALRVVEWRASDAATEMELLSSAAFLAKGREQRLELETLPQHVDLDFLGSLGAVTLHTDQGAMLRNVGLEESMYQDVLSSYRTGAAVWWMADGF